MNLQASSKSLRLIGKLAIIIVTLLVVLVGAIGCNKVAKSGATTTTKVSTQKKSSKPKSTATTTTAKSKK